MGTPKKPAETGAEADKRDKRISVPMPEDRRLRLTAVVDLLNSRPGPGRVSDISFAEWAIEEQIKAMHKEYDEKPAQPAVTAEDTGRVEHQTGALNG